ncbi:MAG: amino acid adenylation domain-containing protein, partial [Acidobacteriota bacterium]
MTELLDRVENLSPEKRRLLLRKLAQRRSGKSSPPRIPRVDRNTPGFELSFAQQRLWFLDQLEPLSSAYNIPIALRLTGRLDRAVLQHSVAALIRRHETLRTRFVDRNGVAEQRITSDFIVAIPLVDLSHLSPQQREDEARRLAGREGQRPFDLAHGPLLRSGLLRLGDEDHIALLTLHHIVSDGWSSGVLVREISTCYQALAAGNRPALADLPVQYVDYAVWQRQWLTGEALNQHLTYWKEQLPGAPPLLELPTDRPRSKSRSYAGDNIRFHLDPPLVESLRAFSQEHQATLFMTLLAGFGALLQRYSRQPDVLIGSPVANRTAATENLIGFFVNTLVLRVSLTDRPGAATLLRRLRQVTLGAYEHQNLPFEMLVDEMQPERVLGHSPLFQVMLTYQNTPQESIRLPGLSIAGFSMPATAAQFDLELLAVERQDDLECSFIFSTELFDRSTLERMAGHLPRLLTAMVDRPTLPIPRLSLLATPEVHQLTLGWNDTTAPPIRPPLTPQLVLQQMARTPDRPAVEGTGEVWSYRHLERQTARVVGALQRFEVPPEGIVAVLAQRGPELAAALLGCFQAGAVYLPLDPHHPPPRIRQVLERSGATLVLVSRQLSDKLEDAVRDSALLPALRVVSLEQALAGDPAASAVQVPRDPSRLAYVIYTSGSTGIPKGVMVEHRGMLNHLLAKVEDLDLVRDDVVAQTASQCFDISIWQFVAPLLIGARLNVFSDEIVHDPAPFLERTEVDRITILETVPSLLALLVEESTALAGQKAPFSALRWMIPTGEALPPELARRFLAAHPGVPMLNAYGPTECSDDVSHHRIELPPAPTTVHMPVGRPIRNFRLNVLDGELNTAPIGVVGELLAAGTGVGRGYLADPVRTALAYLPDPLTERAGSRIYRTGDLARFLASGEIEFLGRGDDQVKVRGFRIELGEIEAAIVRHPSVREAVVVDRNDPGFGTRLAAYVVGQPQGPPAADTLREYLADSLPEYMVPSAFVLLPALPLTANGKVDRKALPDPGLASSEPERQIVAPRSALEKVLVQIWSEVLGRQRIGIHDNFFALGGDSILSIRIVAQAKRQGLVLTVKDVFDNQSVAELAACVEAAVPASSESVSAVGLSAVQHRWLETSIGQLRGGGRAALFSASNPLPVRAWRRILSILVAHHDALRLRFETDARTAEPTDVDAAWHQTVAGDATLEPLVIDLSRITAAARESLLRDALRDLAAGLEPLEGRGARVALVTNQGSVEGLGLSLHPLIADASSWRILAEDLIALRRQAAAGEELSLAGPAKSCLDWARHHQPRQPPPARRSAAPRQSHRFRLSTSDSARLDRHLLDGYRAHLGDGLLTVLARALSHSEQAWRVDQCLDGRRNAEPGLRRTVGQLASLQALTLTLPSDAASGDTIGQALKSIKEQIRRAAHASPSADDGPPTAEVLLEIEERFSATDLGASATATSGAGLRDGYALALSCRRHDDGLEIELAGSAPYQGFEIEALADRVRRELAA